VDYVTASLAAVLSHLNNENPSVLEITLPDLLGKDGGTDGYLTPSDGFPRWGAKTGCGSVNCFQEGYGGVFVRGTIKADPAKCDARTPKALQKIGIGGRKRSALTVALFFNEFRQ